MAVVGNCRAPASRYKLSRGRRVKVDQQNMETILNLLWLTITLGAIGVWRFRWLPSRRHSRTRVCREAIALLCALALLFPAISLTDDLHPESVAVDAGWGKRNGSQLFVHSSQLRPVAANSSGKLLGNSLTRAGVAILPHGLANSDPHIGYLASATIYTCLLSRTIGRRDRSPPISAL